MVTLILGFGLVALLAGSASRKARRPGDPAVRLKALAESRARLTMLIPFIAVAAAIEISLEVPGLTHWAWPIGIAVLVLFRSLGTALWVELVRPDWERLAGTSHGLPHLEEIGRANLSRVPAYLGFLVVAWALGAHPSFDSVLLGYALVIVLSGLVAPAMIRLTMPTRRPTADEGRRLRAVCARYGLTPGNVRVRTGAGGHGTNAFVSGLWPGGSRIVVHQQLIATFDDEEIGFVMAHEVAHRDQWHGARTTTVWLLVSFGLLALTAELHRLSVRPGAQHGWLVFAALLIALWGRGLVVGAWRSRQEYAADAAAVHRTGLRAAQRALARLAAQNGHPLDQPLLRTLRAGHPSTRRRMERVAAEVGETAVVVPVGG